MHYPTLLLGLFLFGAGVYEASLYLRKKQESSRKYRAMKKFFGEKVGPALHFIAYVVVLIVVGAEFAFLGFMGRSIF